MKWIGIFGRLRGKLRYIKPICIGAVILAVIALAVGSWITGLCLLLGSYLLEKSCYCCPACGKHLDMKAPLLRGACCPFCGNRLRE